jgi:hypothetical protein
VHVFGLLEVETENGADKNVIKNHQTHFLVRGKRVDKLGALYPRAVSVLLTLYTSWNVYNKCPHSKSSPINVAEKLED